MTSPRYTPEQMEAEADDIVPTEFARGICAMLRQGARAERTLEALRAAVADIKVVADASRTKMPMGVYPRNQFKHVSDLATEALAALEADATQEQGER